MSVFFCLVFFFSICFQRIWTGCVAGRGGSFAVTTIRYLIPSALGDLVCYFARSVWAHEAIRLSDNSLSTVRSVCAPRDVTHNAGLDIAPWAHIGSREVWRIRLAIQHHAVPLHGDHSSIAMCQLLLAPPQCLSRCQLVLFYLSVSVSSQDGRHLPLKHFRRNNSQPRACLAGSS